jgi:hypothetical protein
VKVVEHSAKKYRADSKKGSPGWQHVQQGSNSTVDSRLAFCKQQDPHQVVVCCMLVETSSAFVYEDL